MSKPERFTRDELAWKPWIEPAAESELTPRQTESLVQPARARNPYFRLLADDPDILEARTRADLDIFHADGGLPRAERELAAAATSRLNGCVFCASVHARFAAHFAKRPEDVDRLLDEGIDADLGDERWNAIAAASAALARTPIALGESDVRRLRAAGLAEDEIVDLIHSAGFFNWANRLMLTLGEPTTT